MSSVLTQRREGAKAQREDGAAANGRHQSVSFSFFFASLRLCAFALIPWLLLTANAAVVGPVPDSLRREAKLAPFYQKHIDLDGFPVLGSSNVSDYAMLESAWVIRQMLTNRADIIRALATNGARLVVMAHNEYTTDIPEQANMTPKVYWDRRARGLGGRIASCGEENMLSFTGDPYSTENILVHEFSHVIHGVALRAIDPTFNRRLREAYHSATNSGLWKGTYAATNPGEYWAEAAQNWFDDNRRNDALHNHVHTRAQLKEYDPKVAALCAEVFGDGPWRYKKPALRDAAGRAHLAGYDTSKAPRFQWRKPEVPEKPRVSIETALGVIEVELDAKAAPHTVTNFLRYVQAGLYNDGQFHRTVTPANQPTNGVKIRVIQASGNPTKTNEFFPPIQIERTRDTGLKHLDGTLSMARAEPDSAQDHFFICVGDQPALDFGGKRNPDGQGFAAFGKVVKGMDVVRKIHATPAEGQSLKPAVRIQRALRAN
jgi:cyclophilin family peptidyl-prolyl cis-trans isomerase